MRHYRNERKGRARDASAEEFERALLGEEHSTARFDPAHDRKTLQLCRQVERAVAMALAGECADDVLRDLMVESVFPMGSAAQLLVRVMLPGHAEAPVAEVLSRLEAQSSRLRSVVAQAICRKRVPTLSFVVVAEPGDAMEGGRL